MTIRDDTGELSIDLGEPTAINIPLLQIYNG